jgi:putative endonuclease
MEGWIYIMTNKPRGTLYVGATGDLVRCVWEHREGVIPKSFTKRYDLKMLVYYEQFGSFELAERREQQLKGWNRQWKVELIQEMNPKWDDLWRGDHALRHPFPSGDNEWTLVPASRRETKRPRGSMQSHPVEKRAFSSPSPRWGEKNQLIPRPKTSRILPRPCSTERRRHVRPGARVRVRMASAVLRQKP